jgi:hypothetical protein
MTTSQICANLTRGCKVIAADPSHLHKERKSQTSETEEVACPLKESEPTKITLKLILSNLQVYGERMHSEACASDLRLKGAKRLQITMSLQSILLHRLKSSSPKLIRN